MRQQITQQAATLFGLAAIAAANPKTSPDPAPAATPAAAVKVRRPKAKKIRSQLGPFETDATFFERGTRPIEITRITPRAIYYRLRGFSDERCLPHAAAYQRATAAVADFDTGPRQGPIKRGS